MELISPDRKQLNNFVQKHGGSFQQSWEWGELQEEMGRQVKRFMFLNEDEEPQSAATFVRHDLPLGKSYWLCPRGPVVKNFQLPIFNFQELASTLGGIFLRIEPEARSPKKLQAKNYKLVKAPHDHNPRATILIDLGKNEDDLLAEMHKKTRYNIKLSHRKGVRVKSPVPSSQFPVFLDLLQKTSGRGGFHLHPMEYYEKLLKLPFIQLFGAYYKDELIAGAIVSVFGERATYLHGASDYKYRKKMAPHLLHWEIIRQMSRQGLKYYDLGGVSPKDDPIPTWRGITRFKKGFGGEYEELVGGWDYVVSRSWYMIYKLGRKIL